MMMSLTAIRFAAPFFAVAAAAQTAPESGFWSTLRDQFNRNLLQGDAYRTVLKGLGVTLEISVLAVLVGTLLGAALCFLRLKAPRGVRLSAAALIALLRGTPVLMLLMLMYYVVFAQTGLSAPLIAVAAFALNFAAHAAELMRSSLEATDPKQAEAARTLGLGRFQAFRLVTLPQAARIGKDMYQSLIVNLIQWTSVVGYVSITDLTKVVNNIGTRTMQPLFMIVIGMVLYLTMAYLTYGIFALAGLISDFRHGRRRAAEGRQQT